MSARKKRWILHDAPAPAALAELRTYPPIIARLLAQRGITTAAEAQAFLEPDYRSGMHDPFLLKGMDAAARRVAQAIDSGERMAVYGDFDADGVTAVTLLDQAIRAMGGDIRPYIPHRIREGYGLNNVASDALAQDGISLLITVDCGISNVAEVAHARAAGLDVIVTDHHTPPAVIPDANAVVNPKQEGDTYPYKHLVGVGIAFKLIQALLRLGKRMELRGRDLLDVVALGTVTDMGPLQGENRVLVKAGLSAINESQRPGLQALIASAGLAQGRVTATDISFMLGPRLNAAGRLDDAILPYKLLLSNDSATARTLADQLNDANRRRQSLTREVQQAARAQADAQGKGENRIVVLEGEGYPAGIVGLVAAKLVDDLGRPVLLLERGEETSRGSARSVQGFNIIQALTTCDDLFVRYGGHAAAAGFTIANDRLPELERRLLAYAEDHLPDDMLMPALEIDADIPLNAVNRDLLETLAMLEPFGQGNPQPVFLTRRVRVSGAWTRGADAQHLKLRLDDAQGGPSYEAIAFRLGHLHSHFQKPRLIDIAYTLENHEWNGTRTLQLNIKDFRRAA